MSEDDLTKLRVELRKDWRFRFWARILAPRFWIEDQCVIHKKWLKKHFLGRCLLYLIWRWNDDVYCPFCGACGIPECCPPELCDEGPFCPYKDVYIKYRGEGHVGENDGSGR